MSATPLSGPAPGPAPLPRPTQEMLERSFAEAEVMDRKGYPYVVHPLLDGVPRCDPALLDAWVAWARQQPVTQQATLLAAPEAMGLPLVAPLAQALGIPFVVIRKRRYDMPGEEVAYCETGYGESCLHVNDCWPDDKVLVVDNVCSTGGTLDALLTTFRAMRVPVVGVLLAVDKGARHLELAAKHGVPVHAMLTVRLQGKKVEVVAHG